MRNSKEIAAEIRKINAAGRAVNAYQNEGGEGYDHTADTSALEKEYNEAIEREFRAEWTEEVTAYRRNAWNKSGVTPRTVPQVQKALGFTLIDLKKAVAMHK